MAQAAAAAKAVAKAKAAVAAKARARRAARAAVGKAGGLGGAGGGGPLALALAGMMGGGGVVRPPGVFGGAPPGIGGGGFGGALPGVPGGMPLRPPMPGGMPALPAPKPAVAARKRGAPKAAGQAARAPKVAGMALGGIGAGGFAAPMGAFPPMPPGLGWPQPASPPGKKTKKADPLDPYCERWIDFAQEPQAAYMEMPTGTLVEAAATDQAGTVDGTALFIVRCKYGPDGHGVFLEAAYGGASNPMQAATLTPSFDVQYLPGQCPAILH